MNLKTTFLSMAMLFVVLTSFASKGDIFSVDENQLTTEFSQMNELEAKIKANANLTVDELDAYNLNPESVSSPASGMGEPPLGIPSFFWGCVLGWVGILIVYLVSEDKEETKKALYGCLAWTVVAIVYYVIVVAAVFASASTI